MRLLGISRMIRVACWVPSPISFRQGLLVKVDNQLVGTEEGSKSLRCSLCPKIETRVGRFSFDCNPASFPVNGAGQSGAKSQVAQNRRNNPSWRQKPRHPQSHPRWPNKLYTLILPQKGQSCDSNGRSRLLQNTPSFFEIGWVDLAEKSGGFHRAPNEQVCQDSVRGPYIARMGMAGRDSSQTE